ncbi:MAG: hypothetical protein J7L55_02865 [Desulfurococcales archaeon]|nr:hypothetical protein [Desulfurococcales archaeon]
MKKEVRTLLMVEIRCENTHTAFFIFRGEKGIEHFGLIPGTSSDALQFLSRNALLEEVKRTISLRYEELSGKVPSPQEIRVHWAFIQRLITETHRLICREYQNTT